MPDTKDLHCPFLNRSDQRCSEMFNLDHLQHAFKHCFDQYHACPMYAQLLAERQGRRAFVAARRTAGADQLAAAPAQGANDAGRRSHHNVLVQVTVHAAGYAQRQPAAA